MNQRQNAQEMPKRNNKLVFDTNIVQKGKPVLKYVPRYVIMQQTDIKRRTTYLKQNQHFGPDCRSQFA